MNIRNKFLFFVFLMWAAGLQAQKPAFAPDTAIVYKKAGPVALKIFIFLPKHQNPEKSALVLFHGGGWDNGKPAYMYRHARYFANRGMTVFCPEYRLRNKNHTTIVEAVRDAESAMAWVRKHAAVFHINPDKIVAGGGSAGGHLAIMTALDTTINQNIPPADFRPDALLLFNPVLDVSKNGYGHQRIVNEIKPYRLSWQAFSPIDNIRPGLPPVLVMVGDKDKVLPKPTALRFEEKMKKAGNDCTVKIYPGGEHTFFNFGYAKKMGYPPGTKNRYYYETLQQADNFLVNHGFLSGHVQIKIPKSAIYPIKKQKNKE